MQDHYDIMGVSPDASEREIKRVYRQLSSMYENAPHIDEALETRFQEITKSYALLSNANKRAAYDRMHGYSVLIGARQGVGSLSLPKVLKRGLKSSVRSIGTRSHRARAASERLIARSKTVSSEKAATTEAAWTHPLVYSEGNKDVTVHVPITLAEAINGVSVAVPTYGNRLKVKIPAMLGEAKKLRIKGKGRVAADGGEPGDLYIKPVIQLPVDIPQRLQGAADALEDHYRGAELREKLPKSLAE